MDIYGHRGLMCTPCTLLSADLFDDVNVLPPPECFTNNFASYTSSYSLTRTVSRTTGTDCFMKESGQNILVHY